MRIITMLCLISVCWSFSVSAADLFVPLDEKSFDAMEAEPSQLLERLRSAETTKKITLVRIDESMLNQAAVDLNLRADLMLHASTARVERRSDRDYTWHGTLPDRPGRATIVVQEDVVVGTIRSSNELFRVRTIKKGVQALIEVDQDAFPADHPPVYDELTPSDINLEEFSDGDESSFLSPTVVEVLVAYTADARLASGGIQALVQLAVDETNDTYSNSKVNIRLHLARSVEVTYSERGRNYTTIRNHLMTNSDGHMDQLHALRDTHEADAVLLIVDQNDYCGLAAAILAEEASAFAVVHYDCATGYYSFGHELGHLQGARHNPEVDSRDTPYRFGHGYQNGPNWRTVMAYNCSPGCPRIDYWSNPNVMHSGDAMGTAARHNNARVLNATAARIAAFRPVLFQAVYNVGDNGAAPPNGIAGYDLLSPSDRVLVFDHNGDGKDDLFLYRPGSGAAWVAQSNGDGSFAGVYAVGDNGAAPPNGIAGYDLLSPSDRVLVFDHNGDGKDDLFLYRPGSGAAWVAQSNGDGSFAAVYAVGDNGAAPPNGIAGYDLLSPSDRVLVFDHNGDGKDDLFLYRPGSGAAWVAQSNGDGSFAAVYAVGANRAAPPNGIAGYDLLSPSDRALVFDHNGDGKDDLFLYRPGSGAAWVAQSNGDGSFAAVYAVGDNGAAPPNGIAGYDLLSPSDRVLVFDHNGNGKDDLFLYRPGSGAAWVAQSNGDGSFAGVYAVGDNGAALPNGIAGYDLLSAVDRVSAFDHNADGKDDLFLNRPGSGAAWVAQSNGAGGFAGVYSVGDNGAASPNGIAGYDLLSRADRVLAFDYNGDGKDDLFLNRPGSGAAWVIRSN